MGFLFLTQNIYPYPRLFVISTIFICMNKFYGRKLGTCTCKQCGVEFQKPQSELTRNEKIGRLNFCSRKCVGKNNAKNLGEHLSDYKKIEGCKRFGDEYTKFRYHYRNIKKRNTLKGIEVTITIEDLKNQWDLQNGICEFTGLNIILSSYTKISKNPIYTASLDRIDSTKGYTKDNIRWVSRAINWMKNDMSDNMVWELCKIISDNIIKKGV
jgi:hypothetical protein